MNRFKKLIEEKAGIRISDDDKLRFAIDEMIAFKGVESENSLYELVCSDRDSFENLVGFLTVNETYFFREPAQIKVFVDKLVPELLKDSQTGRLNIVSAGCSTGAEPYTLVIALMERYGQHISHLFSVMGFDIDKKALSIAEKGVYGKYYFRSLEPRIVDKYFDKLGDGKYKIRKFVSDMVDFHSHNLLHAPYPDCFKGTHIAFYRNVSIYFTPANQKIIFKNIADIICENGYLIMSSTETFPHDFQIMTLINPDDIFLYKKTKTVDERPAPDRRFHVSRPPGNALTASKPKKHHLPKKLKTLFSDNAKTIAPKRLFTQPKTEVLSPEAGMIKAWELAKEKKHDESLSVIEGILNEASPPAKAFTIKASVMINQNRLPEAKAACFKSLEINEFWMEGYFLLGVISKLENELEDSEEKFKKAIYIDSSCWLAHYYLAEIYRDRNEAEKSVRKYEVVINQLEKNRTTATDLSFCAFLFSEKEIAQACRRSMERLKRGNQGL